MPLENFKTRLQNNSKGSYYVTHECIFCGMCEMISPEIFQLKGFQQAFVKKQPITNEEIEFANEAIENCPHEAIFKDGHLFNWDKYKGTQNSIDQS